MSQIGPRAPVSFRHKRVQLSAPGTTVPDADGGYTVVEAPLNPPAMWAHITPAGRADIERLAGNTVLATATHLVTLPYHPGITTETVLAVEAHPKPARQFKVVFVGNPDERNARLELLCAEQVP